MKCTRCGDQASRAEAFFAPRYAKLGPTYSEKGDDLLTCFLLVVERICNLIPGGLLGKKVCRAHKTGVSGSGELWSGELAVQPLMHVCPVHAYAVLQDFDTGNWVPLPERRIRKGATLTASRCMKSKFRSV